MAAHSVNNSTIAEPIFACYWQKALCQESFRSGIYNVAVAAIVFNVPLALIAVLSNGLLFVTYYQNESLRRPANTILLSLAVTDFLTGAVSQPIFIYEKIVILGNCTENICYVLDVSSFFVIFLVGATLLNLSVTTLDRYVAVLHSFEYVELVTNNRVIKVLLALWVAWMGISVAGVVFSVIPAIAVILIIANITLMCVLNYKIFREIRRLEADPVVAANEAEEARKARERKHAKTTAMIVGLLLFCYIPLLLCGLVQHFLQVVKTTRVFDQGLFYIASTVASSNSSLNVLVYFWKNTEIRSAMLKAVRRITQRFRNEVHPA